MRLSRHSAIGVFDSGVGGLTVLKALMQRLPYENTLYLGDTARLPYGTKSGEVVTRYSLKNAQFLLSRHHIKLLVVACNTASAVALPALRAALPIPVIGVIGPGAHAALARTRSGKIGVIGTPGTVRSGAYQRELEADARAREVTSKACPLFVPLAEEGWIHGPVPQAVANEYLTSFRQQGVDTLVLGCTHYPLLKQVIAEAVGPDIVLVDSAEATAEAVELLLKEEGSALEEQTPPHHGYFVTDAPERFIEVGARFLGRPLDSAEQVDLTF